jgi:hypothetical protein
VTGGLAFTATAGAAAARTGLLFVALSINLRQIIANPGLLGRAVEVLIVLSAALIFSVLLLMPGQPNGAAAIETGITAVAVFAVTARIQIRPDRGALGISGLGFAARVIGAHTRPFFLLVGAWIMLVEIVR